MSKLITIRLKRIGGYRKAITARIKEKLYRDIAGKRVCPVRLETLTTDECETNRRYCITCSSCIEGKLTQNIAYAVYLNGERIA